ncbi:MAG: hypothetical protein LAQ30_26100 [Acidobacteriia bacterium]|nr:hypothetical protein [Terriglobia bacterium]
MKKARKTPKVPLAKPARPAWRAHALALAGLWALTLIAYSNSFQSDLIYDSDAAILQDPRVSSATLENVKALLTQDYWNSNRSNGLYRPLTKLSYLFNYAVLGSGPQPASYHWVNFALHAANIALVYLLGLLVFESAPAAVALAALWGVHPILTESITNVVGRADLLSALGVLAGLLCHVKASSAVGRRKAGWLAGLAAAATVGIGRGGLLDGAAHGVQSARKISLAAALARASLTRLLVQPDSALHLEPPRVGGLEGAVVPRRLRGRRGFRRTLLPPEKSRFLFYRLLPRRHGADLERLRPDRDDHGRALPVPAVDRLRGVPGGGDLRRWRALPDARAARAPGGRDGRDRAISPDLTTR